MKRLLCVFVLVLMIPAAALAVTEGVVEAAPQVMLEEMKKADEPSYLPDGSYYAGYGDFLPAWENAAQWVESGFDGECYYDVEQRPRMTAGESERAKALLEAYQKGETDYTGESVLNKMDNVIAGVYALDPDDYDGERAFTILPGPCMTDEQILAVIDAYDQLGLTFDPDALNYRNCARGGGIETNRFFTDEERERYTTIARLIERGMVDVSAADVSGVVSPKLDSRYFCGLPDFTLRPYRAVTDDEMAAALVQMGTRDMSTEVDMDGTERRAREILNGQLGAPLSMSLEYIYNDGGYAPSIFDAQGKQGHDYAQSRRSYGAMFSWITPEGYKTYALVTYDFETKQLVQAHWGNQKDWDANPGPSVMNITDEEALAAAKEAEAIARLENPTWYLQEGETYNDWGACRMVRTQLESDLWLTVYVGGDDGKVHGLEIERGEPVKTLPEDNMPVNG